MVAAVLMDHGNPILSAAASREDGAVFRSCRDLCGAALDAAQVISDARLLVALAGVRGDAALRGEALPGSAASAAHPASSQHGKARERPRYELHAVAPGNCGGGSSSAACAAPRPDVHTAARSLIETLFRAVYCGAAALWEAL